MSTLSRYVFVFGVLGAAGSGCQAIAGIEERRLDPSLLDDGGPDAPVASELCRQYCDDVRVNCDEGSGYQVYYGANRDVQREVCLATCALLDEGDELEPTGNTVACRANFARQATTEKDFNCPAAGPGGNGQCGTNCEGYCTLFQRACDEEVPDCLRKCKGLPEDGDFDAEKDHDGRDTLQCRLLHASSASVLPDTHCWHAAITPGEQSPCSDDPSDPKNNVPTCDEYCDLVEAACIDDLAVYDSVEQCQKVCALLDPGVVGDEDGDTVACRRYHTYSALNNAPGADTTHCPHTGPTGDGHCGDSPCAPYCLLASKACPDAFDAQYGTLQVCESACSMMDGAGGDKKFSVKTAESGDTVECRVLHTMRAFEDHSECESAFGGGECK